MTRWTALLPVLLLLSGCGRDEVYGEPLTPENTPFDCEAFCEHQRGQLERDFAASPGLDCSAFRNSTTCAECNTLFVQLIGVRIHGTFLAPASDTRATLICPAQP